MKISSLLFTFFVFLFFLLFVFEPYVLYTDSMSPKYNKKELIYINKVNYSINSPKLSLIKNQTNKVLFHYNYPKIDDKVIIYSDTLKRYIFSRIVAKPGDLIIVRNNYLYITYSGNYLKNKNFIKTFSNKTYIVFKMNNKIKNYSYQLKEDEYYVLNDNIDNTEDSRKMGILYFENIIGKVH